MDTGDSGIFSKEQSTVQHSLFSDHLFRNKLLCFKQLFIFKKSQVIFKSFPFAPAFGSSQKNKTP